MVYISKDCALLKTDNKNYKQKLSVNLQGTLHLLNRNMWYMFLQPGIFCLWAISINWLKWIKNDQWPNNNPHTLF